MNKSGRYIERQYLFPYAGMFLNFVLFGINVTLIGATMPLILADFSWSYTTIGTVLAAGSIGYFFSTIICGFLIKKIGPRAVICGGLFIGAASVFFFGSLPFIWLNLPLNFLKGVGIGSVEVTVNYSVVRMERKNENHLMSVVHAAFSIGAVIGPIIIGSILAAGAGWQTVFRLQGIFTAGMALFSLTIPFSRLHPVNEGKAEKISLRRIMGPMLVFSFLTILLYVAVEIGISNWIAEYFTVSFPQTKIGSAFMVSLFWAGLLAGRLLLPFFAKRIALPMQLISLSILTLVSLILSIVASNPVPAATFFVLTGLGCSSIYPLVMTIAGQYFRDHQSFMLGVISSGGGIGAFLYPFVMGAIADAFGLTAGFIFLIACGFLLIGSVLMMAKGQSVIRSR